MSKVWKVAVVKDSSKPMLGVHGLHTAFRGLPGVEVVAHVDSNTDNLEQKLAQTQARSHYTSLHEMLEREVPDVVVLCSRHPGDHLEQIRMVAERGCHIYCEKPISVFLEEADEIARIVENTGIKLAVAHPARHDLAFRTMKGMIAAGDIGTPKTMFGCGKCDHRSGGEDLIVLGTHILDLMTYFIGKPESVRADIRTEGISARGADLVKTVEPIGPALGDNIHAEFQFRGGVRGVFESRRDLFRPSEKTPCMGLRVEGTQGTLSLRFDDAGMQPLLISRKGNSQNYSPDFEAVALKEERTVPDAEPLDYSLCSHRDIPRAPWFLEANRLAAWDLIRAIEDNRQPESNIHNARLVVEMIQGIYASHLSNGTVAFPLVEREHPLVSNLEKI